MRLVDADEFVQDIVNGRTKDCLMIPLKVRDLLIKLIEARKTVEAAVVVHCEHCRHYIPNMMYCDRHNNATMPWHYCSAGKRKGE